ncbi:MAG: hypothetical protein E7449_04595 [Ruminococcaceae bacterium]|nr:hypothetical protein [Oscillospiraceae bacterium]
MHVITLILLGGALYVGLEYLWRGRSHISMFLLGGLCFFLVGWLNEVSPLGLFWQSLLGAGIITILEFSCGMLVNVALGLNVWDYQDLPLNFKGQVCLPYFLLWIPVSVLAIFADDVLRFVLFRQSFPLYRLF